MCASTIGIITQCSVPVCVNPLDPRELPRGLQQVVCTAVYDISPKEARKERKKVVYCSKREGKREIEQLLCTANVVLAVRLIVSLSFSFQSTSIYQQ